jgi:acyl dehydratase
MAEKRYFEEFQIGEVRTSRSRLITDADIRLFTSCTSSDHPLHTDALYCATLPRIQKPVVQAALIMSIVDVFFATYISPQEVPTFHYGYDKARFLKPVYAGDSIYTKFELIEKQVKNDQFGILTLRATTYNQRGEVVLCHIDKLYVGRKPKNQE